MRLSELMANILNQPLENLEAVQVVIWDKIKNERLELARIQADMSSADRVGSVLAQEITTQANHPILQSGKREGSDGKRSNSARAIIQEALSDGLFKNKAELIALLMEKRRWSCYQACNNLYSVAFQLGCRTKMNGDVKEYALPIPTQLQFEKAG